MSYPLCPRCGSGRMVPMFLSGPACVWDNKISAEMQAARWSFDLIEVELLDEPKWDLLFSTEYANGQWFYPSECGVPYRVVEKPTLVPVPVPGQPDVWTFPSFNHPKP